MDEDWRERESKEYNFEEIFRELQDDEIKV
jgi:hypothetical protein